MCADILRKDVQRHLCEVVNASAVRAWTHGQVTTLITGCRSHQLHIPSTMCEIKPSPFAKYDAALTMVQKCCPPAPLMHIPPRRPKELGTDAEGIMLILLLCYAHTGCPCILPLPLCAPAGTQLASGVGCDDIY